MNAYITYVDHPVRNGVNRVQFESGSVEVPSDCELDSSSMFLSQAPIAPLRG